MEESQYEKQLEAVRRQLKKNNTTIPYKDDNSRPYADSYREKKETQKIKHNDKDHKLKIKIAFFLMGLLSVQVILIFVLIFLQGFHCKGFYLSEYIFYILISGTLIESYFLVKIVVEHLFPRKQ